jgi:hypothetical protein
MRELLTFVLDANQISSAKYGWLQLSLPLQAKIMVADSTLPCGKMLL